MASSTSYLYATITEKKEEKKRKKEHQVFLFLTAVNAAVVADPLIICILLSISVILSL